MTNKIQFLNCLSLQKQHIIKKQAESGQMHCHSQKISTSLTWLFLSGTAMLCSCGTYYAFDFGFPGHLRLMEFEEL